MTVSGESRSIPIYSLAGQVVSLFDTRSSSKVVKARINLDSKFPYNDGIRGAMIGPWRHPAVKTVLLLSPSRFSSTILLACLLGSHA